MTDAAKLDVRTKLEQGYYRNKDKFPVKPPRPNAPKFEDLDKAPPERIKQIATENVAYTAAIEKYATDIELFKKALDTWHDKKRALEKAFYDDIMKEYGVSPNIHAIIFEMAYSEGHSAGEFEILNYYDNLHSFVKKIILAAEKDMLAGVNKEGII